MRWVAIRLIFGLVVAAAGPGLWAGDRYVGWLRDGSRVTARTLSAWPLPGTSFRLENRELLDTENAIRFLRDRDATWELKPPYLVMTNGDIVPGTLVQLDPGMARAGQVRVQVELESPLVPAVGNTLTVTGNSIARVVVATQARQELAAGTVRLADGRQLAARSIRWRERGLALLTAEGIIEVAFADLAEVVFPVIDRQEAVLADNVWANLNHQAAISRLQTKNGAALTAALVTREHEQARRRGRLSSEVLYYVQPAWADQPLAIPEEEIVSCGYRAANEAPLSCFAATTPANRRLIGPVEPWTTNRNGQGGILASGGLESDLGVATHAHSEVAFDLPRAAQGMHVAVGLVASEGGCVRCKIVNEGGATLWDSGVFEGKDGVQSAPLIEIAGMKRLVLVTEMAHEGRPAGADPFDIRDSVVWISPLVSLDASIQEPKFRWRKMLAGTAEWELLGPGWQQARLSSRWNLLASMWYPAISIPKGAVLSLKRQIKVTRENDVLELFTVCPADLDEHDFQLTVNGTVVPWHNNADRNLLRQWTARYSKQRARDGSGEESNLSDRLAYWWDLQAWRGQEVTLQLDLTGKRETNEIVCRSLSLRPAIGNLPDAGEPRTPDVPLAAARVEGDSNFLQRGSVRLLGQEFQEGYSLARNGSVRWSLKPEFKAFVAVIGCTNQVAGPLQLLVDDRIVWERGAINCLSPAEQIVVELPVGAKTLGLRSGAEAPYYGTAAVVEAGFITK